MSTFIVCPKRNGTKVSLEVCVAVCDSTEECQKYKEVPEEDKNHALAKVNKMPIAGKGVVIDGQMVEPVLKRNDPEEASEVINRALSIKDNIEGKFWEMGEILNIIFTKQYYVDVGYRDWKDFCNDVLDIKVRTATYLKDIYVTFSELDTTEEDRKGIGWSKLKELLPVVNRANLKHWISVAKDRKVSVPVLNAMVKYALGKISKEESEKLPQLMSFRLYEEQIENVERALEIARKLTKSESRSYQLEMIAAEFRATYEGDAEGGMEKNRLVLGMLRKIQSILKVRFEGDVIDEATGEIIAEAHQASA